MRRPMATRLLAEENLGSRHHRHRRIPVPLYSVRRVLSATLELRMVVMDLPGLRMIGPGQYKSMGTGGMKNEEVRASLSS